MSFPTAPLWAQASLNDEVLPEATHPDWEFEYIDIGSVSRDHGVIATQRLTFGNAPSRARRVVRAGDVIVSTVRTYLRAVARIPDQCDGCVASTGFAVLRARRNADASFLGYAVVDPVFVDRVIALSVGVVRSPVTC